MQTSGKLKFIEKEGELMPNIFINLYYGHTRGQVIPTVKFGEKYITYCADLFPATAHIPMPYIMGYDMWAEQTLRDKEIFFKDALEKNSTLFFEHDIYNECCNLIETQKGVKVNKTFKLIDFVNN